MEINKILTSSSQPNTVVEKFFVTFRSPKTEVEEKQRKLIEVFKTYNTGLKDNLERCRRMLAKRDSEYEKLAAKLKEMEVRLAERDSKCGVEAR